MQQLNKNVGFILIFVLLFLQIISLYSLYNLMAIAEHLKLTGLQFHQQSNFQLVKKIMHNLEQENIPSSCMWVPFASGEVSHHAETWWQNYACSGNFSGIRYYYVFEKLGMDECGVITTFDNEHPLVANYYRLDFFISNIKELRYLLFQSTVVTPGMSTIKCRDQLHAVNQGEQMWRFQARYD